MTMSDPNGKHHYDDEGLPAPAEESAIAWSWVYDAAGEIVGATCSAVGRDDAVEEKGKEE